LYVDRLSQVQTAVTGLSASLTGAVVVSVGASIASSIMHNPAQGTLFGMVAKKHHAMDVVFLVYHLQFLTFIGDIGGPNTSSPAVRHFAGNFRWSLFDFGLFELERSSDEGRRAFGTCSKSLSFDLLLIAERLVTCVSVFAVVVLARMTLRAFLSRVYPSHADWSLFEFPAWEIPTVLCQFCGVAEVLLRIIGHKCSQPSSQFISAFLMMCGPGLLVGRLTVLVRQYRKDGILCYQVSTSTTWSETRTRIRVSGLWGKIMAFRRWLQLNRFCGCWNLNDPRVRYLDVMLESYNDSFVLFFAFQMSKQLWIALVSV